MNKEISLSSTTTTTTNNNHVAEQNDANENVDSGSRLVLQQQQQPMLLTSPSSILSSSAVTITAAAAGTARSASEQESNVLTKQVEFQENVESLLKRYLISESIVPYNIRPFASSTDWLLKETTTDDEVHVLTERFINNFCSPKNRGCYKVHILRPYTYTEEVVIEEGRGQSVIDSNNINNVVAIAGSNNSDINGASEQNNNHRLKQQRSMVLWKNEQIQSYNMNQNDTADYLAEALDMYETFPKITFWIQVQGRHLTNLYYKMLRKQQQRNQQQQRHLQLPGQPPNESTLNNLPHRGDVSNNNSWSSNTVTSGSSTKVSIMKGDSIISSHRYCHDRQQASSSNSSNPYVNNDTINLFVRSKIWKWSNKQLSDQCLFCLIHIRNIVLKDMEQQDKKMSSNEDAKISSFTSTNHVPPPHLQNLSLDSVIEGRMKNSSSNSRNNNNNDDNNSIDGTMITSCIDYDIYVAQNLDNPYDILEYSLWNNYKSYNENFMQSKNIQQLLNRLYQMEEIDKQNNNNNECDETSLVVGDVNEREVNDNTSGNNPVVATEGGGGEDTLPCQWQIFHS